MDETLKAYQKVIDLLSRRDHSPKELELKLIKKGFEKNATLRAIQKAAELGYIKDLKRLSEQLAHKFDKKLKGIHFINHQLKTKDLPPLPADWDHELEKAKKAIAKELSYKIKSQKYSLEDKKKIYQFLSNRGYAQETIRKILG